MDVTAGLGDKINQAEQNMQNFMLKLPTSLMQEGQGLIQAEMDGIRGVVDQVSKTLFALETPLMQQLESLNKQIAHFNGFLDTIRVSIGGK